QAAIKLREAQLEQSRQRRARGEADAADVKEAEAQLALARADLIVANAQLDLVRAKPGGPIDKAPGKAPRPIEDLRAIVLAQQAQIEVLTRSRDLHKEEADKLDRELQKTQIRLAEMEKEHDKLLLRLTE